MKPLTREQLFSLEQYAEKRPAFRAQVIEHKKNRRVDIGPNLSLYFEDRLTVQYQVQEMLRIERIFEAAAIEEELEAYNPLIPDGSNLKCTGMFEFTDVAERRRRLAELSGVENHVWLQVDESRKGLRDFQRGPRALHRREDLGRAFHALRTDRENEKSTGRGRHAVFRRGARPVPLQRASERTDPPGPAGGPDTELSFDGPRRRSELPPEFTKHVFDTNCPSDKLACYQQVYFCECPNPFPPKRVPTSR